MKMQHRIRMMLISAVLFWTLLFCQLGLAAQALSFDNLPKAMQQCVQTKLTVKELHKLTQGKGDSQLRSKWDKVVLDCYVDVLSDQIYTGPLFDAMAQIDEKVDMQAAMRQVQSAGVVKIALFARSRKQLHQNERSLLDLKKKFSKLIVLGVPKYFKLRRDISDRYIQSVIQGITKHKYHFIGEILFSHGDKKGGEVTRTGERYIDPTKPGTYRLLTLLKPLDVPLMIHWEAYAYERDAPRFCKLYAQFPKQRFILPHMGFLGPDQVVDLLARNPNLYMTLSKKHKTMKGYADLRKAKAMGSNILDENLQMRPEWRQVLVRYADRILFATDAHRNFLWKKYERTIKIHRILLGQLPQAVAEKMAFKNAELLYGVTIEK